MAVKIRMKMMGRKHRQFFRICATDSRAPRDGRVLEELGTYDPKIPDTDARALLNNERIDYWLSVGAQASEKVGVLIKKYGSKGVRLAEQQAARERLSMPKVVPPAPEPVYVPKPKHEEAASAEGAPAEQAPTAEHGNGEQASGEQAPGEAEAAAGGEAPAE
ncbi:MAG TPA: 30S ribosomal protein S16 [Pirellulales bacterium]|nr:30S ribosomal protein S16 [Pirellulales bacterium]